MKTVGQIVLGITITIVVGWLFYAAWQGIIEYQKDIAEFPSWKWLGQLSLVLVYLIVVIPGLIYSWFPLPKEFSDLIIIAVCGGGFYLISRIAERGNQRVNDSSQENNYGGSDSYSSSSYSSVSSSNSHYTNDVAKEKRIIGHAGHGDRVNPKTGVIQKEGLIGWVDTDKRIDPETGNYQKEGLIGWNNTETRIDQDSGIIQKEGLISYLDTDTRVNPETGVIQKEGLIGWVNTDKRIDPETGKSQHEGLFGWVDD